MATEIITPRGIIVDDTEKLPRLLKKKVVLAMVGGVNDSTLWRREQRGEFPRRIRLSARLSVYKAAEILDWLDKQGGARE